MDGSDGPDRARARDSAETHVPDGDGAETRSLLDVARRRWRLIAVLAAGVLVLVALGVFVYLSTPYGPDRTAVAAVEDREDVVVERTDGAVVVRRGEPTPETVGVVFYPGARVHPESYVPALAPVVAERDVLVVIPEMPLNLAVLDPDAAADVRAESPVIDRWIVGGHSLGGAMACRHAAGDPDRVDGVVLFAAYCDDDLRGTDLPVLSVLGSEDGVIDSETERANRELLGPDATVVAIEGLNHAGFGAYGDQRGDRPATIDPEFGRERVAATLQSWLDREVDAVERADGTDRPLAGERPSSLATVHERRII